MESVVVAFRVYPAGGYPTPVLLGKTTKGTKNKIFMNLLTTKKPPKEMLVSDIELLEMLINKMRQKLQDNSYEPKAQDVLKAIQLKHKLAPASESEEIFWGLIDGIKRSEYEKLNSKPSTKESLEAQILKIIIGLKEEVKNGALPVKIITDTFNQGRSKESHLSYRRIGRLLSTLGFRKAKTHAGTYAILWDDQLLSQNTFSNDEKNEKQPSASPACPASL